MKLTISSIFDFATVATSKAAQELTTFIDFVNRLTDEVVKALRNRLTFADNFQGQQVVVELVHGVESKIAIDRPQVLGVLHLKTSSTADVLTSMVTSVNQEGQLVILPNFKLASSTKLNVTLFILFP